MVLALWLPEDPKQKPFAKKVPGSQETVESQSWCGALGLEGPTLSGRHLWLSESISSVWWYPLMGGGRLAEGGLGGGGEGGGDGQDFLLPDPFATELASLRPYLINTASSTPLQICF